MNRWILGFATLGLLLGVGQARAGIINGYADVNGFISGGPNEGNPTLLTPVSASASQTITLPFAGNGLSYIAASGQAEARLVTPPGLFLTDAVTWQLHTQARYPESYSGGAGIPPGGVVFAAASWQDVLILSNTNPALVGNTVRLNFVATLFEGVDSGLYGGEASTTLVATGAGGSSTASTALYAAANAEAGPGAFVGFYNSGWDSLEPLGGGYYTGNFHLDIPMSDGGYIPGVAGSFYYELVDTASAGGYGPGTATAGDPLGFTSITLPDVGNVTPESLGVGVTFESGIVSPNLQPTTAVPEPASLTLLGIGIAGMAGYGAGIT